MGQFNLTSPYLAKVYILSVHSLSVHVFCRPSLSRPYFAPLPIEERDHTRVWILPLLDPVDLMPGLKELTITYSSIDWEDAYREVEIRDIQKKDYSLADQLQLLLNANLARLALTFKEGLRSYTQFFSDQMPVKYRQKESK